MQTLNDKLSHSIEAKKKSARVSRDRCKKKSHSIDVSNSISGGDKLRRNGVTRVIDC